MIIERFVYGNPKNTEQVTALPLLVRLALKRVIKGRALAQGIGGHANEDIIEIISKDLRAVSKILGTKKFILGDEPCFEDAAIFGQLSQCCWGLPNSPYEKLVNGEFRNYVFCCESNAFKRLML